jgi:hypothetical protein
MGKLIKGAAAGHPKPKEAFQLKKGIMWLEYIILLVCETACAR